MALKLSSACRFRSATSSPRARGHPACHPWHHHDQPLPGLDAAVLGGAATSCRFIFSASQSLHADRATGPATRVATGRRTGRFDLAPVRRGLGGPVLADRPDRRAGRLSAVPAAPPEGTTRLTWWAALIAGGPGWVVIGALKIFAGSFLAFYAFRQGVRLRRSHRTRRRCMSTLFEPAGRSRRNWRSAVDRRSSSCVASSRSTSPMPMRARSPGRTSSPA